MYETKVGIPSQTASGLTTTSHPTKQFNLICYEKTFDLPKLAADLFSGRDFPDKQALVAIKFVTSGIKLVSN